MYKNIIYLSLLFSITAYAECEFPVDKLAAVYTVESLSAGGNKLRSSEIISLWRNGNEVAQEYHNRNITDIWTLVSDGRIRPVRYFDGDQRAIEYQPNEVSAEHDGRDWSSKFQFVSNALLGQMRLINSTGRDCDLIEFYQLETKNSFIELEWLPNKKLVNKFAEENGDKIISYTLSEIITDDKQINEKFLSWGSYQATDYADIGDDHSDPFLLKMVNLGFIEHGASGFYNSDGSAIEEHNH